MVAALAEGKRSTVAGPRTYLRLYSIDALAEPMVSIALIGVPVNGQKLLLRNNGTAQPVDLGPQIVASGVARFDHTVADKTHLIYCAFDGAHWALIPN